MIHLSGATIALIAGAAFLASAINAVGGGGSLLSFPSLLVLGVPALVANISNTVALVPGYAGGTLGYRRELSGQAPRIAVLGSLGAAGAVLGALLLTHTPESVFQRIVPWLILGACALLAVQPLASRLARSRDEGLTGRDAALGGATLVTGAYAAFFAAGLGVLLLAVLALLVTDTLQRLNALKSVLSLIFNIVAAAYFALLAPVAWTAVAVMVPASFAGGFAGVALGRRVPDVVLRITVIALGVALSIRLLV